MESFGLNHEQGTSQPGHVVSKIDHIIEMARKRGASDIHIVPDDRVMLRINGELVQMPEESVGSPETEVWIRSRLKGAQFEKLETVGEAQFAYTADGEERVRVCALRQRGAYALVMRLLPGEIPEPGVLGVPEQFVSMTGKRSGLVLAAGAAGSGRTTTLASLIGAITKKDARSVITLEKPIEYLYPQNRAVVFQREIGTDSRSFAEALRMAMRQDADVIFVGELCDAESISLAVTAAETGHLVFSLVQTNSAQAAVDCMVHSFLPHQQQQIRERLAGVLEGIAVSQLLPRRDIAGRIAAYEILLATPEVRSFIQEGKTYQLSQVMQNSRKEGMMTMDDAIYDLYMRSHISAETAIAYAQDGAGMQQKVQLF